MRSYLAIGLTLAACSPQQPGNEVDIGDAARAAQASSQNYVGDLPAPAAAPGAVTPPATTPLPGDSTAPAPASTPEPAATPTEDAPAAPPATAADAATTVRTYFTLLERRQYARAWRMWDRDGAASGMTPQAFAASFDKYADYHAQVGTPGRVDSGAGQRYVTVPVKAYGTLRTGKPFTMEGPVTLHRTADIDGATTAQRMWRVSDSALRPRPAPAPSPNATPANERVVARYRCADGTSFRATFDNGRDIATLGLPTGPVRLKGQRPASGIWYAADGYDLRGKGNAAMFSRPNGKPTRCTADR